MVDLLIANVTIPLDKGRMPKGTPCPVLWPSRSLGKLKGTHPQNVPDPIWTQKVTWEEAAQPIFPSQPQFTQAFLVLLPSEDAGPAESC